MRDGIEEVVGRDGATRNETALQRMDRNLVELLQEVRVVQTGVQVLFAFLLTAPLAVRLAGSPDARVLLTNWVSVSCLAMTPRAGRRRRGW